MAAVASRIATRRSLVAVVWVLAVVLPAGLGLSDFTMQNIDLAVIYAILAVSLNLVFGLAGQLSLGHGALFAIGAYASGIITTNWGQPFLLGLLGAIVAGAAAGLLIGAPSLRLRTHYFAFATLAFAAIVTLVIVNLQTLTGGSDGLTGIPLAALFGWQIQGLTGFYYLALAFLALTLAISVNVHRSRLGRALTALREDELAARASGLNVSALKLIVFVISAVLAGVAGSLFAHLSGFVSPDSFGLDTSVLLVAMVMVGGLGTITGGVIGGVLLTLLPEWLRFSQAYYGMIYGAVIALLVVFLPGGIVGIVQDVATRAGRRPAGRPSGTARARLWRQRG